MSCPKSGSMTLFRVCKTAPCHSAGIGSDCSPLSSEANNLDDPQRGVEHSMRGCVGASLVVVVVVVVVRETKADIWRNKHAVLNSVRAIRSPNCFCAMSNSLCSCLRKVSVRVVKTQLLDWIAVLVLYIGFFYLACFSCFSCQ